MAQCCSVVRSVRGKAQIDNMRILTLVALPFLLLLSPHPLRRLALLSARGVRIVGTFEGAQLISESSRQHISRDSAVALAEIEEQRRSTSQKKRSAAIWRPTKEDWRRRCQ